MKRSLIAVFLFIFTCSGVFAASSKIYDENGFRIGTCTKNGEVFEAYDLDGKPILQDVLGNSIPAKEVYFYDISGNLRKYTSKKRTIAPVNFVIDGKTYKGPIYSRRRLSL